MIPFSGADKRAEDRMIGYFWEATPECGHFTLVRNGTGLKSGTHGGGRRGVREELTGMVQTGEGKFGRGFRRHG